MEERPLLSTPRHRALRTVWVSDVHLGSRECRVNLLLDFLRHMRCDVLYLVGDIIDLENLRKSFYWPASHTEVLRLLLKKSQEGTRIVYVPGNHDHDLHALAGTKVGGIEIANHAIHTTRSGRRLLVTHGDQFDAIVRRPSLGVWLGGFACRRSPRPARRKSTVSSAATSIAPRSPRSTACSIATTAIGSRAARRSSRIRA